MQNADPVTCILMIVLLLMALAVPVGVAIHNRRARRKTDKYLNNRNWKGEQED
jgi:uncharacterized membrane protein affecting hemolysin expression